MPARVRSWWGRAIVREKGVEGGTTAIEEARRGGGGSRYRHLGRCPHPPPSLLLPLTCASSSILYSFHAASAFSSSYSSFLQSSPPILFSYFIPRSLVCRRPPGRRLLPPAVPPQCPGTPSPQGVTGLLWRAPCPPHPLGEQVGGGAGGGLGRWVLKHYLTPVARVDDMKERVSEGVEGHLHKAV